MTSKIVFGLLLLSTSATAWSQPAPSWKKVTEHAEWAGRDSCGEAVFKGRMWLLGGWFNSYEDGPRDVWSSGDGAHWKLETRQAPWKHADLPMTVAFADKLWMMGGWHGGRLKHASASNQVWASADGVDWKQTTPAAGWSPRIASGIVVFQGRIWILGGLERYYDGNESHLKNDVWSSADGVTWKQATAKAEWSPRAYHAAVALSGKLWIMGGGNYLPGYKAHNDVWSSSDGVHWTQEAEHAAWPSRIWFFADVYRDRMWVLGGWSNNQSRNWNDVWWSTDGKTWKELKTPAVWSMRHEHSGYVFDDRLWVVGGNSWPLVNDVWQLQLPKVGSPTLEK